MTRQLQFLSVLMWLSIAATAFVSLDTLVEIFEPATGTDAAPVGAVSVQEEFQVSSSRIQPPETGDVATILERPLFAPNRLPRVVVGIQSETPLETGAAIEIDLQPVAIDEQATVHAEQQEVPIEPLAISLMGVMLNDHGEWALIAHEDNEAEWSPIGMQIGSWELVGIFSDYVVFAVSDDRSTYAQIELDAR